MPTGDPAIDAAFGSSTDTPAPTSATGDDAIDAAFSGAAPAKPVSGADAVGQMVRYEASKIPASIAGGARSIYDITLGGKSVAQTDQRYQQWMRDHTSQPTDPAAAQLSGTFDAASASGFNPLTWPARGADALASNLTRPSASMAAALSAPGALPTTGGSPAVAPVLSGAIQGAAGLMGPGALKGPAIDAQAALDASAAASPQSMGAAAAAPQLTSMSPPLQQAVRSAVQQTGGAVNPEIMARHAEADSLPVKMQLTEGQASQDPQTISQEQNTRGRTPQMVARMNEQNQQLVQNVQALRDRVGPDVFSTNPVEHGDTLIQAYKDKDDAAQTQITQNYKALKDANGGQFPVDAPKLLDNATQALHQELLFDHAPKAVMSTLGRLSDANNMTFENFESLRTNLARIQRSPSADGNEKAAAGVIRDQMEQLPLAPGAAKLKPLADTARASAKAQFAALDADPAYKAAIQGDVTPDRFVQKYIVGAPRDQVATMKANMAGNDTATQTMGVAALDHLRQSAGIDPMGNGNFTQAGFNKQLNALSPKLNSLVDPKTAEDLEKVGNVARYTQAQPRGSYVNNSNTLVGALAEHAAGTAEGLGNLAGAGVLPLGTMARKVLQTRAANKATEKSLAPGAGLTRLSDIAKIGQSQP
jgi:hypothetical protein